MEYEDLEAEARATEQALEDAREEANEAWRTDN
jgi:hypothetical protein